MLSGKEAKKREFMQLCSILRKRWVVALFIFLKGLRTKINMPTTPIFGGNSAYLHKYSIIK
jgi:hypothetical protein